MENFSNFSKFNIDIKIDFVNDNLPVDKLIEKYKGRFTKLSVEKFPVDIKENLVFEHRKYIKQIAHNLQENDYILYIEDDILISEESILIALNYTENVFEKNKICGFLRYEEKNNEKHLIDLNKAFENINKISNNIFTIHNLHQGCWLLNKEQILTAIDFFEQYFDTYKEHKKYGCLEQGATGLFLTNKFNQTLFEKIYPRENLEYLTIHHLPNKFINLKNTYYQNPGCITLTELINLMK